MAKQSKAPVKATKPTPKPRGAAQGKTQTKAPAGKAKTQSRRQAPAPKKQAPKSTRVVKTQRAKSTPRPVREGMSLDRKLDILGVFLALAGLLILLSLVSSSHGSLTGGLVSLIETVFGLGMYIFPGTLIVTGLWLVLRNFERIPQLAIERLFGLILLFTNLLAIFHFIGQVRTGQALFALVETGLGGGYAGALVLQALQSALGVGGSAIALAAWLLIALALTFDRTVLELFRWIAPLYNRLQDGLVEAWQSRQTSNGPAGRRPSTYPDFTPIPGSGTAQERRAEAHPAPPPGTPAHLPLPSDTQPEPRAWVLPPTDILDKGGNIDRDDEIDHQLALIIQETLASFGAPAHVVEINRGPTITQFGVEPDFIESRGGRMRVRVGKIAALADDLALALSARTIRIQAPVPGKGFIGIEVPNEEIAEVALRDIIENEAFRRLKSPLRFALGENVAGNAVAADLAAMPHLLIAGATGSGKSVCVNAFICCLLMNNTPDDLRFIMVDPKRVELTGYNGIPHLLAPVVVELERVVAALQWVTREMDMRYRKLAEAGARNIQDYNARMVAHGQQKLPYLVVIIDELADLMMLAPDETERTITRLAQLARATGIHLVIATQRPSVDVVTGLIKANFPARVAFAVASGVDSRVILDQPGAERLLGRGDMLFQAPDAPAPVRLQGVFVSDIEIQRLVTYWQGFSGTAPTSQVAVGGAVDGPPSNLPLKQIPLWEEAAEENMDPLLAEATDLARRQGRASISMLQRRLRIGYTRAARLIETMEEKGIVGPPEPGSGAREILDYGPAAPPVEEERD